MLFGEIRRTSFSAKVRIKFAETKTKNQKKKKGKKKKKRIGDENQPKPAGLAR